MSRHYMGLGRSEPFDPAPMAGLIGTVLSVTPNHDVPDFDEYYDKPVYVLLFTKADNASLDQDYCSVVTYQGVQPIERTH